MAVIRYHWLRQFSLSHQTEWTPNATPYCKLCRRNIVVNDVTTKTSSSINDIKTSAQVPSHLYVNSQADSSNVTTSPQNEEENGDSLSSNFYKQFRLLKTISIEEGTMKDSRNSIVMQENGNKLTVVTCGHRQLENTI